MDAFGQSQGASEKRTKAYVNTMKEHRSLATQRWAKSVGRVFGFAKKQAKTTRLSGGYTVVEVMIFLTISAMIFVTAQLTFRGQQGRTQFQQGMHDTVSKVQQLVGQVGSGIFPGQSIYSCATSNSTGRAALSSGGSVGSNQDCIFLGSALQVVTGKGDIHIYTVLGNRSVTSGTQSQPAVTLSQALPEPAVSNGANLTATYPTPWATVLSSKVTNAAGTVSDSTLVGFYNSLQAGYFNSGSSGGQAIIAKGYNFSSNDSASVNSAPVVSCLEELSASGVDCTNTPQITTWAICFQSTGSSRRALLTVSSTPAGITSDINFTSCT